MDKQLAKEWRQIEAWDRSIANDKSFHISTRNNAARRADVAKRYAEECEGKLAQK